METVEKQTAFSHCSHSPYTPTIYTKHLTQPILIDQSCVRSIEVRHNVSLEGNSLAAFANQETVPPIIEPSSHNDVRPLALDSREASSQDSEIDDSEREVPSSAELSKDSLCTSLSIARYSAPRLFATQVAAGDRIYPEAQQTSP